SGIAFRIRGFDVIDACLDAAFGRRLSRHRHSRSLPKRGRDAGRLCSTRTRRAGAGGHGLRPPPQRPEAGGSSAARAARRPRRAAIRLASCATSASATTSCTISRSCAATPRRPAPCCRRVPSDCCSAATCATTAPIRASISKPTARWGSTEYSVLKLPAVRLLNCCSAGLLRFGHRSVAEIHPGRLILLRTPRLRCSGSARCPMRCHSALAALWTADSHFCWNPRLF
uniref:AraC family transcriptional regulator n=1 Tax=Macrostomum lignano TaxID=282301 RepID=A0A1I8GK05_9PLAT